jgi:hypothetical protein
MQSTCFGVLVRFVVPPLIVLAGLTALDLRRLPPVQTWSPWAALGVLLGGVLPLEEFVFFVVTNTLTVFRMLLVLARGSHERSRLGRRL